MDREQVDHVLATIDEAIDDWTSPDAMRWRPPGSGDEVASEFAAGVAYFAPYMASINAQLSALCRRRGFRNAVIQVPASAPDTVIGGRLFGRRIVRGIGIDRPTVVPVGVSLADLRLGTPESH